MVIDLGCHAGGWSQIILERVSREGLVIGVATQQLLMCSPKKVDIHQAVFCLNNEFIELIYGNVLKSDEFMKLIDGFTFCLLPSNEGDDDPQDLTSNTTGQSLGSAPFFPDFMIGASPSTKLASEDKVLMEPLENHHFVQGDIEKESTVRPQEILLNESTVVEVVQQTLRKPESKVENPQPLSNKSIGFIHVSWFSSWPSARQVEEILCGRQAGLGFFMRFLWRLRDETALSSWQKNLRKMWC